MHFLTLPDSKNKREHETVAFLTTSRQQKRARMRYCPYFLARRSSGKPQSAILSSLSPPEGARMRDCQHFLLTFAPLLGNTASDRRRPPTTAGNRRNRRPLAGTLRTSETSIFATPLANSAKHYLQHRHFQTAKTCGNTRLLHFLTIPDSKNEREHETVAFSDTSRQQKRAGTRDCCIF